MSIELIAEALEAKDWELLSQHLNDPKLYSLLLQKLEGQDLKEAIHALLIRSMDPLYLDLCVRDLAWKRKLEEVEILLEAGASPAWGAVGFALAGEIGLADQYWTAEYALEGASWKGPVLAALKIQNWPALTWMASRGAQLLWLMEEDEIVGNLPALEIFVDSLEQVQILDFDTWIFALGVQTQLDQFWSLDLGLVEDKPLSPELWQLCEKLLNKGYVHPGFVLLAYRQGLGLEFQSAYAWDTQFFLQSEPFTRDLIRLLVACEGDLEKMQWLAALKQLGLDYFKVMNDERGRLIFADELMYGSLARLQSWWPQLKLAGLSFNDLLLACLRARRFTWLNWVMGLGEVNVYDAELLIALEDFPAPVRKRILGS